MYIIRFQKFKYGRNFKDSVRLVVIKQGSSVHSFKQVAILGYFNKKQNLLVLKFDLLLIWLSKGVNFTKPVHSFFFNTIKL